MAVSLQRRSKWMRVTSAGEKRNKRRSKKLNAGRGTVGKTAVVGARDRDSNDITAKVVRSTDG